MHGPLEKVLCGRQYYVSFVDARRSHDVVGPLALSSTTT